MEPAADASIIAEFQERRRRTGERVRPWFIPSAAGAVSFMLPWMAPNSFSEYWRFWMIFGGFFAIGISLAAINIITSHSYLCPKCGRMPRASRGILLDPDVCPFCGVPLKE